MKNFYTKGISVFEILIVCAILAVVFAVTFPGFSDMRERQVLKNTISDIVSAAAKARSQTLASVDSSSYGVRFEPDKIIIFKGTSYASGDPDNEVIPLSPSATISNVTLSGTSGGTGSLFFARISGSPDKSGTLSVSTPRFTKTITISPVGTVSVN